MTPTSSDDQLLALHGLAIKKAAEAPAVAEVMGLPVERVTAVLDAATDAGQVMQGRGKYILTPDGRSWLDEQYPAAYAELRSDPEAARVYARFETVNRDVLALMTRWQTMNVGGEEVPNDHSDPEYDGRIIDELGDRHEEAAPILDALVALVPRFSTYPDLLAAAYARVSAGETDYLSGVRVASYHTVWFEMHEDLLRLLGRAREE